MLLLGLLIASHAGLLTRRNIWRLASGARPAAGPGSSTRISLATIRATGIRASPSISSRTASTVLTNTTATPLRTRHGIPEMISPRPPVLPRRFAPNSLNTRLVSTRYTLLDGWKQRHRSLFVSDSRVRCHFLSLLFSPVVSPTRFSRSFIPRPPSITLFDPSIFQLAPGYATTMTLTVSSMVPLLHFPRIQHERDTFAMMAARESVFNDQLEGIRTFHVRDGRVFGAAPSQGVVQSAPDGHLDGGRDDGVGMDDDVDDGVSMSDPSEISVDIEELFETGSDFDNDDRESA